MESHDLTLSGVEGPSAREAQESGLPVTLSGVEGRHHEPDSIESIAIKANFVGSNPNPRMVGLEEMEYKCNYFIGNDPNEWHTDVPNYNAIVYEDIYSGIDLKYYGNGKQMEYDFVVSPGADFSQIQVQYDGAESISVNDNGELVVETEWGEVIERRPVVYQLQNGSRVSLDGRYRLLADNSFGFSVGGDYDPSLPLVIDPVLSYSTYLGETYWDEGYSIAVDSSGDVYLTGWTYDTWVKTEVAYQTGGIIWDVFVTKLTGSGEALIYSTFLGGDSSDAGYGIAVDDSGNAYITGGTGSSNFPTISELQTFRGYADAFVTKLNSSGNALVYSTYLGGGDWDSGEDIAVDSSGNAYIAGWTQSTDFPTEGEYQTYIGGVYDAYVTKLSSSGNALVYSTFLGGDGSDIGRGIAVDDSGNAYITGSSGSSDFPTEGAYQSHQGGWDAFVTKLNSAGNDLIYSTYLGGTGDDRGYGIAVAGSGNAYITGSTNSTDFPTENEYQAYQGERDVFVTKLRSSGSDLIYSTYLGGSDYENGNGIAVNGLGNAYITGYTYSTDFPIEGEYQTHQGDRDVFVTKLDSSGSALVYSTYL
ncbi:MAG: SBBP repeat-containing protein, partial [candidate division Zixibacteria bacterium]|nr:SBBP repeat-containing protein [candidate division Zixibacteria bacterium]